jgi:ribosomal protein S28E/S33
MTPYRFNPDDNTEFAVLDATTFIAGDFGKEIFKVFENRFLLEVFKMISRNGEIGITLEVDVEISGGTTIDIGIDGQPLERYYFPTFCDSLLVPTLTEDSRNLDDLANRYRIIRRDVVNPVLVNVDGSPLRDDSSTTYTPDRPFKIF